MSSIDDFLIKGSKDTIKRIIVNSFRDILVSYGIIPASCFILCLVFIVYIASSYDSSNTVSEKELERLQQSAYNGNAEAQKRLGDLYFNGTVLPQDYEKAFTLYMQSAEQNNNDAQYQVGLMYYNGEGVSIDYHKSYLYYALSKLNGNSMAYLEMQQIKKKKLLSLTEIADITIEAQNRTKRK